MHETHERAVSEVISFVLVFALIALTVGVVYATGFGGLNDSREAERVNNAERAFDVLADNIEDITQRGAPSRATEIKLADASIGLSKEQASASDEEAVRVTVEITNYDVDGDGNDDDSPLTVRDISSDPIVYTANRPTEVVYSNGAVMRSDRGSATMVREPNSVFHGGGARTAVIPLVETRAVGSAGVGGDTTVLVRTVNQASNVESFATPGAGNLFDSDATTRYTVRLTISSTEDRAEIWRQYYNEQIPDSWSDSGTPCGTATVDTNGDGLEDDVVCEFEADRLFVSSYSIDVTFA